MRDGIYDAKEIVAPNEKIEKQKLTYNLGSLPDTLDPNKASELVSLNIIVNIWEGLIRLDENDQAVPGVAERWEVNEDATEFIFYLRENAKWSDGKPVTAYDFEYSWKRALNPNTNADYAYQLYYIKNGKKYNNGEAREEDLGIKVIDDRTIHVTLEGPTGWMEQIFALPTLYPVRKDVIENNHDSWALDAKTLISNGPFTVQEWEHYESIKLVPNDNYWNRSIVKLDEIDFTFITMETEALAAYNEGRIDGSDGVPQSEIPMLQQKEPGFKILPRLNVYYYVFNNQCEPLDDERVRKSLSYSIDRKEIVETITLGGQKPATGIVPYGIKYGGEDFREVGGDYGIEPNTANVKKARKLLAEAGYPMGRGFPKLEIRINNSEGNRRIGESIKKMWKENLNIDVDIISHDWSNHLDSLRQKKYQIGNTSWVADYFHPMTFLELFQKRSGNNHTRWGSYEYDKLIKQAKFETNPEKVNKLMHRAEDMLMERMTIMPIYYQTDPELMKTYVKGWRKNASGYLFLEKAYIERNDTN